MAEHVTIARPYANAVFSYALAQNTDIAHVEGDINPLFVFK